ncbi:hypothetical protein B932_3068 [Gluconobacter oxydans H24]|nr:hypothetical protein B932_3068 [Gluconobacter oxydans H24]
MRRHAVALFRKEGKSGSCSGFGLYKTLRGKAAFSPRLFPAYVSNIAALKYGNYYRIFGR